MSDTSTAKDGGAAVPPDPIYRKSYSVHIAVASVAVVGAVALAIADEVWLRRPYKAIQADYKAATLAYLEKLEAEKISYEEALRRLDRFKELDDAVRAAVAATEAARMEAQRAFDLMDARASGLSEALRVHRSEIAALTYDAEHAAHEAGDSDAQTSDAAKPYRDRIAEVRARTIDFTWKKPTREQVQKLDEYGDPVTDASGAPEMTDRVTTEEVADSGVVGELIDEFIALQNGKGAAQRKVGDAVLPRGVAAKARDAWVDENIKSIAAFLSTDRGEWDEDFHDLEAPDTIDRIRARVARRVAELGVNRYLDEAAAPVSKEVVRKVREKLEAMPTGPLFGGEIQGYQIHLAGTANWVDRCEVCHLGARSVIPVTEADLEEAVSGLDWPEERIQAANLSLFASHPRAAELFAKHDPEKVGCSTCHNGNGIAITSTELAHGLNHHWLWPLHPKENAEAGCLQCHQGDLVIDGGDRISAGREAFREKGCWGCHPYQGHDREGAEIKSVGGELDGLRRTRSEKELRRQQLASLASAYQAADDEESQRRSAELYAEQAAADVVLVQEIAQLDTEIHGRERRLAELHGERTKIGPSLKELRAAMRPEVLTPWIQDPTHVRPTTKMPVFRWWGGKDADGLDEEAKDVAAFLFQGAPDPANFPELNLSLPAGGSAGRGKQLFEETGCLACHSIERDGLKAGNDFAADLSLVGEKKTPGWIHRWIRAPRHRLIPYSTTHGRDLTKAEWEKEDPETLVWRNPTAMPDFRLDDDDARDIATYLSGLKSDRKWPEPTWLQDPARAERGRSLVIASGCAGCHEIAGLESERGIGTDLTTEGTKPLERLDFGHLTTEAKRGHEPLEDWESSDGVKVFAPDEDGGHAHGWYRQRGFFMHKLAQPDLYDRGKYFADRYARLKMPKFRLTAQELHDLTTFLLGSVESKIPSGSRYQPDEAGQSVRDGWWVVRRYNCEGCHAIRPGDAPAFQKLPWWTAETIPDMTFPPTLVGEGFRVRPDWLAHFLQDPSLGGGTAQPKSLRRHLAVRMPTFHLSEEEIARLVRFFGAMSGQPPVYQPPALAPLTAEEKAAGDLIWSKDAMNCLQCHLIGDMQPNSETKAPHFGYARERLRPEWMERWIPHPALMQPWTKMTKNFNREVEGDERSRWIYMDTPKHPVLQAVKGDHADLMVRYIHFESWPK